MLRSLMCVEYSCWAKKFVIDITEEAAPSPPVVDDDDDNGGGIWRQKKNLACPKGQLEKDRIGVFSVQWFVKSIHNNDFFWIQHLLISRLRSSWLSLSEDSMGKQMLWRIFDDGDYDLAEVSFSVGSAARVEKSTVVGCDDMFPVSYEGIMNERAAHGFALYLNSFFFANISHILYCGIFSTVCQHKTACEEYGNQKPLFSGNCCIALLTAETH